MRINSILVTENKNQYFYDYQYDEINNEYHYYICKYDSSTGKTSIIDEPADTSLVFIDEIDGNIYFQGSTGIGIYDEATNEKELLYQGYAGNVSYDEQFFYFRDDEQYLHRIRIGETQAQKISDLPIRYYCITDNYIYYKTYETNIIGQYNDGSNADMESQKIYRMNKDGSHVQLIWEFQGESSLLNCDYFFVIGNYIYSNFLYWNESEKRFIESQNAGDNGGNIYLMRVDIENQELYFFNLTE